MCIRDRTKRGPGAADGPAALHPQSFGMHHKPHAVSPLNVDSGADVASRTAAIVLQSRAQQVKSEPVPDKKRHREQLRAEALLKGYTGEMCSSCASFTLVRNGTCLKCMTCGMTSGCS